MRKWIPGLAVAALLGVAGCPHSPDCDPLHTAFQYLEAAAAGDVETCFRLLGEDAQKQCDRACLAHVLERQRAEFRTARDELRASLREKTSPGTIVRTDQAIVRLADGSELQLRRPSQPVSSPTQRPQKDGAYRFTDNPLSFYPQDTPERALRSFLLAVERRRWDVLLEFLPRALAQPTQGAPYTEEQIRQRFEGPARSEIARQLTTLRQHLGDAIQLAAGGAEARLPVGENKEVRLRLEDGSWRLSQLE